MQAVASAPTGFYMDVDFAYQMYAGGIYSGGTCGTSLVHARTLGDHGGSVGGVAASCFRGVVGTESQDSY